MDGQDVILNIQWLKNFSVRYPRIFPNLDMIAAYFHSIFCLHMSLKSPPKQATRDIILLFFQVLTFSKALLSCMEERARKTAATPKARFPI